MIQADKLLVNKSPQTRLLFAIRKMIADGVLQRGSVLPSEVALCASLSANRQTMHKALLVLENEGVLVRTGPRTLVIPEQGGATTAEGGLKSSVVVFNDLFSVSWHGSGWMDAILKSVFCSLDAAGLNAMSVSTKRMAEQVPGILEQRPAGGLLLCNFHKPGAPDSPQLQQVRSSGLPFVAYGDDPLCEGFDRVISDHKMGMYALTRHLLELGYRKLLMLGISNIIQTYWFRERQAGFAAAMQEAGVPFLPEIAPIPTPPSEFASEEERWRMHARYFAGCLAEYIAAHGRPDVILSPGDGEIFSIATACRILGFEPGQDIEITGYDNLWGESPDRRFEPYLPLATVDKQNPEIGRQMVALLLEGKAQAPTPEPRKRLVATRLVTRE